MYTSIEIDIQLAAMKIRLEGRLECVIHLPNHLVRTVPNQSCASLYSVLRPRAVLDESEIVMCVSFMMTLLPCLTVMFDSPSNWKVLNRYATRAT